MRVPRIHSNGTTPGMLLEDLENAYQAVEAASRALALTAPNGRDYYVQGGDALTDAINEHAARRIALTKISKELMQIVEGIEEQVAVIKRQRSR